jgi:hypothetical protein
VRTTKLLGSLFAALALSGCLQDAHHQSTTFLDQYARSDPMPAQFWECHGFSCKEVSSVSLSATEWQRVGAVFKPAAKDAKTERRQVSQAVTLMHRLVGAQTGTAVHQWTHKDSNILPNLGDPTQLDCIDGAVNTWTYMTMMEKSGFLRFHHVAKLSNAGALTDPRNTAVLRENSGGGMYAVDPSLVDFGVPPPVIPLATWMGSWPPSLAENDAPSSSGGKDNAPPPAKRKTAALAATPPPAAAGANR